MKLSDVKELIRLRLKSSTPCLAEDEAKKIFHMFGIPVVKEKRETSETAILAACRKTGFPVVLKGSGKNIMHKTESGLVRVGLNSEDEVRKALEEMNRSFSVSGTRASNRLFFEI